MNTATNYAELYFANISMDQQELENVVRDYPVSSTARFLLLYQLKKNDDARFDEVAKQTGIYLHNPSWMEFQLADISTTNANNLENDLVGQELVQPVNGPVLSADREINENPVLENQNSFVHNNEENENDEIAVLNPQEEVAVEKSAEELSQPVNEQIIENPVLENENFVVQNNEESENVETEVSNPNEEVVIEKSEEELPRAVNEQIIQNPVLENENSDVQNNDVDRNDEIEISVPNEVAVEKSAEELPHPVNEQIIENPVLENENSLVQNNEEDKNEEIEVSKSNEEVVAEKSAEELSQPVSEQIIENPVSDEENISFEPLHTVDYFASQGIKLSEEALNNDQLGKQVKSFTAWLKSMKKLHPGQLPEQNEVIEKLIQTSSEVSNKNANVLTEAMAEVLIKQGKREKAVEMYQKLSLLNPSKSAYFAGKIESLKII